MPSQELVTDLGTLRGLEQEWDALAVADALPLMSPAWIMAWWSHLAPPTAEPRAVIVRDGEQLIGLAPFFVERESPRRRIDYRLPGIELSVRLAPLALPGCEWQVAEAIATALADAMPRPDAIALEGAPLASQWEAALVAGWPGRFRPLARRYHVQGCPVVPLRHDSYEAWVTHKSAHFRNRLRRLRRLFDAAGGTVRLADRASLHEDLRTLVRLHSERWSHLGDSNLVVLGAERITAMFESAGEALIDAGRFRLFVIEVDGAPAAAYFAIAAGGEVLAVNGGWDERFAHLSPSKIFLQCLIGDAIERGDARVDLGLGELSYKQRFADGNDPVAWSIVMPPQPRLALTVARTAPMLATSALRDASKRALTQSQADRVRAIRERLRRQDGDRVS